MALSYVQYTGDGSTTDRAVPFPFISRSHVEVKVNNVVTTFTWVTDGTIRISPAPAAGTTIDIRRNTPDDDRLVNFQDASSLTEADLDLSADQQFYLQQELIDREADAIRLDTDTQYNALSRIIKNVADGVNANDAVNRGQMTAASLGVLEPRADLITFPPSGGIAAANVRDALQEVDKEKLTSVTTITALRAAPTGFDQVNVLGYYATGDGGGGTFYWDSASTATDDGGVTIRPDAILAATPGRWRRADAAFRWINVRWFGVVGDGVANDTAPLQAAIDYAGAGDTLYVPRGLYKHTGVTVAKSLKVQGDIAPHYWDNDSFNALGGGTRLWQSAATGNNITISPPDAADRRIEVVINDVVFIGAKYNGSTLAGTPTSGHGIFVDGRLQAETAAHVSLNRVAANHHAEHGIFLTNAVYGQHWGMVTCLGNGKNNVRFASSADPIGEFSIEHLRTFQGGANGTDDLTTAGVYLNHGAQSIKIGLLTSTQNTGPAVLFGGGAGTIDTLHCESPQGTPNTNAHSILKYGDGTSSPSTWMIRVMNVSAGTGYLGSVIRALAGARRLIVDRYACNEDIDEAGGAKHFNLAADVQGCKFLNVSWVGTLAVTDDGGNYIEPLHPSFRAARSTAVADITGDATNYTVPFDQVGYDRGSNYSTTTYRFTAPLAGDYHFDAAVGLSGADGVNHATWNIQFNKSGTSTPGRAENSIKPTAYTLMTSCDIEMARGDYLTVEVRVEGGTKVVDLGSVLTRFSGHLVRLQ